MRKSSLYDESYLMLSKWINGFKLNKNKVVLLICKDISLKTKYAKKLAKENNGYYFDLIDFLESKLGQIEIANYDENDFLNDITKKSDSLNKMIVVDQVEPLFGTWRENNFSNFLRCLDLVMCSQIIAIFSYYFPQASDLIESERIKIVE